MHLISVDLEIGKRDQRILALAAVDERTGAAMKFERNRGRRSRAFTAALAEFEEFCSKADCLVGHNLIAFDIPHLQATAPDLALLRLPVLDTLRLSPLAFPANPYHRLVKHYQDGGLVRGQVNNPELDARLTLDLLADERDALRNADPDLLVAWHWLTARASMFFSPNCAMHPAPPKPKPMRPSSGGWPAMYAPHVEIGPLPRTKTVGRWRLLSPGCPWPAAIPSCRPGFDTSSPQPVNS